ncbi:MAG TPA: hypothetical protein PKC43_08155 [Phycisphaerales bacterium]|nr:hypothetical protein [Phycisphaerales bacterium]HMP37409.1 hypothetical protein [Phycisphaerales bacterium]
MTARCNPSGRSAVIGPAALAAALLALPAAAQHAGDVLLAIEGGAIVTGAIGEDSSIEIGEVVFVGTFGDSGFPGFTANPGFDAFAGTFPPQSTIGFDILEPLQRWSGAGFDVVPDHSMTVSFLSLSVTTGGGFVPGFALTVPANGSFHRHYSMFVDGPGGAAASPGVYLLVRSFRSSAPGIDPSEPVYFVLGHQVDEGTTRAAAAWLRDSLEPVNPCSGDLDGNGVVDGADLGVLLGAWGLPGAADLDGNGLVDGADLGILLGAWGICP